MISSPQLRAARALLGWSQDNLAEKSGISKPTIARLELTSGGGGYASTHDKLQSTLEAAGVIFIGENGEGPGVRLRKQLETVAALTEKISTLEEVLPAVEPETEPSPAKAMNQLDRARGKNEITKLKNKRAKIKGMK